MSSGSGQDVAEVLAFFGKQTKAAREAYRQFISDAAGQGKRQELIGGGLQRVRKSGVDESPIAFDDRILGSGEFVQSLLAEREEGLQWPVVPLAALVSQVAEALGLTPEEIRAPGRSRQVADARSVISHLAFRKMGYTGEAVARELGISRSGVCRRACFGERLVLNDKRFQAFLVS